jgi:hypothetical protein
MKRRSVIALVCATMIVSALVSAAVVGATSRAGTGVTGKTVTLVKIIRAGTAISGSPTVFADIPGSVTTNVSVPSGTKAILDIRFTAESACDGGSGADWCSVRILVDGDEAKPASAENYAFDSTNDGAETGASWEGHALERSTDVLTAGTYTVTAQWYVTDPSTSFRLDDVNMTVERIKV